MSQIKKSVNDCISASIAAFDDIKDDENDTSGDVLLTSFPFPINQFDGLRSRLPYHSKGYKVIIDYEDGYLHVRTVPGLCHEAASRAWDIDVNGWANNYTPLPANVKPVLKPTGSRGMYYVMNYTDVGDYNYSPTSKKSPDGSFTPQDIQIPPALPIPSSIKPGRGGTAFPTLVFEFAHKNESLQTLKNNASSKAFTPFTSIRVLVGIKIFKKHLQGFWARRSPEGAMNIVATTTKMDANVPTDEYFAIPAVDIFWGCGQNYILPPLPAADPPLQTPHLILAMERLRLAIVDEL